VGIAPSLRDFLGWAPSVSQSAPVQGLLDGITERVHIIETGRIVPLSEKLGGAAEKERHRGGCFYRAGQR